MADLEQPNRKDKVTLDNLMTPQFSRFVEAFTEIINHFQFGDGDPSGVLETDRKMVFIRQDGGVSTTLYINELGDGTSSGWRAL
jgi:hypothetical protein